MMGETIPVCYKLPTLRQWNMSCAKLFLLQYYNVETCVRLFLWLRVCIVYTEMCVCVIEWEFVYSRVKKQLAIYVVQAYHKHFRPIQKHWTIR